MDKADITASLVSRLVADQFPAWADRAVTPVELDGWDNTTFRLGDDLSVRLPSADWYIEQVDKEHRWLPILARHVPLPVPRPVGRGVPGCGYPRPWSIYRWLEGDHATAERVTDLVAFAGDLAEFLRALHHVDPDGGPPPGTHNFFRGGSLAGFDAGTRKAIAALDREIDGQAATAVWDAALAAPWPGPDVWVHGDISATNLLVDEGRLCAVIDFGCCAVGDPAGDLAIAWTFFGDESRDAFRTALPLDGPTWARGRGWALWKALITLVEANTIGPDEADAAGLRLGWRHSARHVIEDLLAEAGAEPHAVGGAPP